MTCSRAGSARSAGARWWLGAVAVAASVLVENFSAGMLVGWAFAIAASSFCPLLVLGIWWRDLTWPGALAGALIGGGGCCAAIGATMAGLGRTGWAAVLLGYPAIWTVPISFGVMIVVSLATRKDRPVDVDQLMLRMHMPEALHQRLRRPRARAADGVIALPLSVPEPSPRS